MKNILDLLSQVLQLIRSSQTKLPGRVLIIIRYLNFLIDLIKKWINKDKNNGTGSQGQRFGTN